jgi:putative transposase
VIVAVITEAHTAGARLARACRAAGISARTVERWRARPGAEDARSGPRHRPRNALSPTEQAQVVTVMTSARFGHVSPKQLVPQLADQGLYLASESTMYRLRRRLGLPAHRSISRTHVTRASGVHRSTGANQVWSWDITWLPTTLRGSYLYLYLVMDVWSRRIVGWTVEERETADAAAALVERICRDSGVDPRGLVLHSDNGKPMRGSAMVSTLQWLGIIPSFSRPHVSDDNPYSEALFRTLKHTPAYPRMPFADVDAARCWVARFVAWYNAEHRHSAIRYVTPDERHFGVELGVLARRTALYEQVRAVNPERWSRSTRDWSPVGVVLLNPEPSAAEHAA